MTGIHHQSRTPDGISCICRPYSGQANWGVDRSVLPGWSYCILILYFILFYFFLPFFYYFFFLNDCFILNIFKSWTWSIVDENKGFGRRTGLGFRRSSARGEWFSSGQESLLWTSRASSARLSGARQTYHRSFDDVKCSFDQISDHIYNLNRQPFFVDRYRS